MAAKKTTGKTRDPEPDPYKEFIAAAASRFVDADANTRSMFGTVEHRHELVFRMLRSGKGNVEVLYRRTCTPPPGSKPKDKRLCTEPPTFVRDASAKAAYVSNFYIDAIAELKALKP